MINKQVLETASNHKPLKAALAIEHDVSFQAVELWFTAAKKGKPSKLSHPISLKILRKFLKLTNEQILESTAA